MPYCPRCGTALSSHEVALGYEDVEDPSIYVRFPLLAEDGGEAGESLLVEIEGACLKGMEQEARFLESLGKVQAYRTRLQLSFKYEG